MSSDWIKHDGKGYPRHLIGYEIEKRYRDGVVTKGRIIPDPYSDVLWKWNATDSTHDIIEYRVVR